MGRVAFTARPDELRAPGDGGQSSDQILPGQLRLPGIACRAMDRLLRRFLYEVADLPPAQAFRALRELIRERITIEVDGQFPEEHPEEPCPLLRVGIGDLDALGKP